MSFRSFYFVFMICALGTALAIGSRYISVGASAKNARPQQEKPKVAGQKTPEEMQAKYKAHEHDFDYLLGDWEFTAVNKVNGRFRGFWSAVRLPETEQIMDEFRTLGPDGDTFFVSTTWRAYDALLDQWELVSVDARRNGLQNFGTGHRVGDEVRIEQKFGEGTSTYWISRIRYYNIQADRFSWNSDRSFDGGKTWTKDFQQIEAHRIGPPRAVSPLTSTKKTSARAKKSPSS